MAFVRRVDLREHGSLVCVEKSCCSRRVRATSGGVLRATHVILCLALAAVLLGVVCWHRGTDDRVAMSTLGASAPPTDVAQVIELER